MGGLGVVSQRSAARARVPLRILHEGLTVHMFTRLFEKNSDDPP